MAALGVGATLREERLRRQLSLGDIARQTKIPERSLQAIESEDFDVLPGIVFTRNFVRQYALTLQLDPTPLLQRLPRFDVENAPMPEPPLRPRRAQWDPRWNSTIATVAWTLLAVAAAGAAYIHFNKLPRTTLVEAKSPQPRPQPKTEAPVPAAAPEAAPLVVPAVDTHSVHVVIKAIADSWVQLTADGKNTFVGTIKAGESETVTADTLVKILTGNAGGVEVSLNGKRLDSLGPSGQVRTLRLTAAGPQPDPKTQPQPSPEPI